MLESRGDGAWIMKKCSDCLQGTVGYTFEPRRTIFELSCPAPVRLDELELEQMPLGSNVWGVGVDDCEFQRLILGGLFESVGLPAGRVEVLGGRPEDLERLSDWLVTLLRERLPAHARVLTLTPTLALALALALSRALALTLTLTLTFTLTLTLTRTLAQVLPPAQPTPWEHAWLDPLLSEGGSSAEEEPAAGQVRVTVTLTLTLTLTLT